MSDSDLAEDIPQAWMKVRLGEVVTQPRSKLKPDPRSNLPFVGMDGIEPGSLRIQPTNQFSEMKSAASHFMPGDVIYGRMRPYLNKVARADFEGASSAEFIVFPENPIIDGDFLKYLLHQRSFVSFAARQSSGDRPRVDFGDISSFQFALPPAVEQRRIVAKIDELFSRIDAGEASLRKVQALLKTYRQSVLKAAVTGELTKDWRAKNGGKGETGHDLLKRILKARREAWEAQELAKMTAKGKTPKNDDWKKKYKEPKAPDTTDLPDLPEGWVWASVEQLGQVETGTTPPTKDPKNYGGSLPFMKPTDLNAGYDLTEASESLSDKGAALSRVLPPNAVLVTCIGATIGKVGLSRVECATNQQINALVPAGAEALSKYAYWFFASEKGQDAVKSNASATTLPILNKSKFERLCMPLPPMDEIVELVGCIEAMATHGESLMREIDKQLHVQSSLRQSVLRSAFSGQLVPQNPSDEPAFVLLERIASERTSTDSGPKHRRKPRAKSKMKAAE